MDFGEWNRRRKNKKFNREGKRVGMLIRLGFKNKDMVFF